MAPRDELRWSWRPRRSDSSLVGSQSSLSSKRRRSPGPLPFLGATFFFAAGLLICTLLAARDRGRTDRNWDRFIRGGGGGV